MKQLWRVCPALICKYVRTHWLVPLITLRSGVGENISNGFSQSQFEEWSPSETSRADLTLEAPIKCQSLPACNKSLSGTKLIPHAKSGVSCTFYWQEICQAPTLPWCGDTDGVVTTLQLRRCLCEVWDQVSPDNTPAQVSPSQVSHFS